MKKVTATLSVRVLGTTRNEQTDKGQPPYIVMFESITPRPVAGSDEVYEERTVERFKSPIEVPKGWQNLRVELGAYVNGTQGALYGRVVEILPPSGTPASGAPASKKPAEGGRP